MELEEFSKYLNEEVIKNYSDIIFGQDIAKIYSVMVELAHDIPFLMTLNKKNQLLVLKNNILYLLSNAINGEFDKEEAFNKVRYILKMQYRCLNVIKKEIKYASLEKTANIYLYFYLLVILGNESIKYCENVIKQNELEHKGINFIPNDGIDIEQNKNTMEKVSRCVKKIKSVY